MLQQCTVGDVHLGRRAEGLVPIDEVLGDLPGHVDAGRVGRGSGCRWCVLSWDEDQGGCRCCRRPRGDLDVEDGRLLLDKSCRGRLSS